MQQKLPVLKVTPETTGNAKLLDNEKVSYKASPRLNNIPDLDMLEVWVRGLSDIHKAGQSDIR